MINFISYNYVDLHVLGYEPQRRLGNDLRPLRGHPPHRPQQTRLLLRQEQRARDAQQGVAHHQRTM